jgi:nucleoside-diphosphate-sugar epimerase
MSSGLRALVTGGCGFIGSNICHKLMELGWKVDVVDDMSAGNLENLFSPLFKVRTILGPLLSSYEREGEFYRDDSTLLVVEADMENPGILSRISRGYYDVVFHLAANPRVGYSVDHPAQTTDINCTRSLSLIEAVVKSTCHTRFVFSSTCAVYGNADQYSLPTQEWELKIPLSPYGLQKSFVEDYISMAATLHGLDGVSLRYFNVYGPRQDSDSAYATAITSWCSKVKSGQPLRSDGDGEQTRDLVYVDDVVNANILAATSKRNLEGRCYNVGSGVSISNNAILDLFKKKFGNVEVTHAPARPGDVRHTLANIKRANSELGYEPGTRFEEGLGLTWKWWGFGL